MMHRTTINLDETIYKRVKIRAKRRGKSMARTIQDILRKELDENPKQHTIPELPLHTHVGVRTNIDIADRDRLYDLMEGG